MFLLIKLGDVEGNDVANENVCNAKIKDIEDITKLATNTTFNAKSNEGKSKVHITNLATTTALNAVQIKTPDQSNYINTAEFNKLTAENYTAKLN